MSDVTDGPFAAVDLQAAEAIMGRALAGTDVASRIAALHLATGGKRLRARLALASVAALGGRGEAGAGWAAACELVHNATLVHDDLQDGDRERRGHPAMWVTHGAAQAINVGDLMLVMPYALIAEVPVADTIRWRLCHALSTRTVAVVRGQADELELLTHDEVTWAAYEASVRGKTSALFELPVLGAALIAGRSQDEAGCVAAPFRDLGVLFQMQDDVLDLYGDKGRGLIGSDLYEGKVSCLVVAHCCEHPDERQSLYQLLRTPRPATSATEVAHFIKRFREGGALAAVLTSMRSLRAAIAGHEAWQREPRLLPLAVELMDRMMSPIAHVVA
jgi:geranylgeranyl pyrophosphate synthase